MKLSALPSAIALAFLCASPALAAEWTSLVPAEYASTVELSVDTKKIIYYRFDWEHPLVFTVDGPTRLKILTRLVIPNDRDKDSYSIGIVLDGRALEERSFETVVSTSAFYVALDSVRPGVIRRIYLDVPAGAHTYEIEARAFARVDARVFTSATARTASPGLAPRDAARVETFVSGDKELEYYVVTTGAPVVLDVVGPATLRVNTRLLFDETMSRREVYTVAVRDGASPEVLYRIESVPSKTVTCRDRSDVVPGALRHFLLEVGTGLHTFQFTLVDTAAKGLAMAFRIPRGDPADGP